MNNISEVKTKLSELSLQGGGSFVKRMKKSQINPNSKVLFVGVGGMGCNTINELKRVFTTEYDQSAAVKFLAIDTDESDIDKYYISKGGYILSSEYQSIYDNNAQQLLINRPPIIESWLSPAVPSEPINGTGAKARRAVGRVMLCGTQKYETIRRKISDLIDNLNHTGGAGTVNVVLVAGISGGTGSGSFIDIGYMIRMLLEDKFTNNNITSEYFGVFYTPDVQKSIPEIGGDPATWSNVRRNGYAALKELDYFMNIGDHGNEQNPVYRIDLPGGESYSCGNTIFDKNKAFIVSPTAQNSECQSIVRSVASGLMSMFQPGVANQNGQVTQSVISNLCNLNSQIGTWENKNVGKSSTKELDDPCGISHTAFPAFMNYAYSSFGYREIYFPRNEMAAYCANEAFNQVYEVWQRAFRFKEKDILSIANRCKLDSIDAIYQAVYPQCNISYDRLRITPESDGYPKRKGAEFAGVVINTDETVAAADSKVNTAIQAVGTIPANIITGFVNAVKAATLENQNFLLNYGPFGGIVALMGSDTTPKGIIQRLKDMDNGFAAILSEKKDAADAARNKMVNAKEIMKKDRNPHDSEMEDFVSVCHEYSKKQFEYLFYQNYMQNIVRGIISGLLTFNKENFEIYQPIIETIKVILNEDATVFAQSTLQQEGSETIYSLNAFNLGNALNRNDLFAHMFDGYIDKEMVKSVANGLVSSLFIETSRNKWKKYKDEPAALADEIRRIFSGVIDPLVSSMLEKFMVVIYGNPDTVLAAAGAQDRISIDDVNKIWNDVNLRNEALNTAAQNIVAELSGSEMVSLELRNNDFAFLSDHVSVILLAETPNLNVAIQNELQNKYPNKHSVSFVGSGNICDRKTSITLAARVAPIALAMVSNMADFAGEYFDSEKTDFSAGRHLNEISEKWQFNMPELYGVDAERYFVEELRKPSLAISDRKRITDANGNPVNHDLDMYEKIRDAVDYGIIHGYIRLNDANKYVLIKLKEETPAFIEKLKATLVEMKSDIQTRDANWIDALNEIEKREHRKPYVEIALDRNYKNLSLTSRQHILPEDDFSIKNIYRVVRADMEIEKLVFDAKKFYEESQFFYDIDNLINLNRTIELYLKANVAGLISHERGKGWSVKYSSNQFNKPIVFFEDKLVKSDDFDRPMYYLAVISAFAKVILEEKVVNGIEKAYAPYTWDRDAQPEGLVHHPSSAAFTKLMRIFDLPLFANEDTEIRNEAIDNYYKNSNYKDYYSYPLGYKNADTIFENLKLVIKAFEYFARYNSGLFVEEPKQDDESE